MKLATFMAEDGIARVGAVVPSQRHIVCLLDAHLVLRGAMEHAFVDMLALMRGGESVLDIARTLLAQSDEHATFAYPLDRVRLLAPVPKPEQIRDCSTFDLHMRQAGAAIGRIRANRYGADPGAVPSAENITLPPVYYEQPIYYKANRFNVVGHEHDIRWPRGTHRLDYEAEFGVYIGRAGRDIEATEAWRHVFGFTIFNDFSARDLQEHEMEGPFGPAKGKDFDTGNAMGPWIVTPDEIPDPNDLKVVVRVNGEEWSRGSTRDMRHGFERIIAHVSRDETIHVGEFLGSGTIGGCCGLEIDRWLRDGDVVEVEFDRLGVLRNRVVRNGA